MQCCTGILGSPMASNRRLETKSQLARGRSVESAWRRVSTALMRRPCCARPGAILFDGLVEDACASPLFVFLVRPRRERLGRGRAGVISSRPAHSLSHVVGARGSLKKHRAFSGLVVTLTFPTLFALGVGSLD